MSKATLSPMTVARHRRQRLLNRRGYVSLLFRLGFFVLAVWLLFSNVFLLTQCRGQDMFPAMEDGDLVLAYRLHEDYKLGDVVVYSRDGKFCFGRIVALGNDTVMMSDSGSLIINGAVRTGDIMYPTYAKEGTVYPFTVPEGRAYVLGDYRTQAKDSRDYGPIPIEYIEGKVITIVRRRGV